MQSFFIGSLNGTASTVYIRPTATVVVSMNASKMPQPSQRTSLPNHKTSVKGIEKFFDSGYFCCGRCCFSCRFIVCIVIIIGVSLYCVPTILLFCLVLCITSLFMP